MTNGKYIISLILILTLLVSAASAASLTVGPKAAYKTVQSAVNAAHDGDTINVLAGTYPERVFITENHVNFVGQPGKYPTVYGFVMGQSTKALGAANINGFRITKYGIIGGSFGSNTIQNNYFVNCGVVGLADNWGNNNFINNQFTNGGIHLASASRDNVVTGNTFYKAKIGLELIQGAYCTKISGNTFSNCVIGIKVKAIPSILTNNKYIKNKVNIQTGNF